MKKRRIFLACSDDRLRIGLVMLLDNEPGLVISGLSDNLSNLISQLEDSHSNVLLLDWEMPLPKMKDLLTDIHCLDNPPEIIFLSSRLEEKEQILAAGADYFFTKDTPPNNLLKTLNSLQEPEENKSL